MAAVVAQGLDPVVQFEATRADYVRQKRVYTTMFWVAFVACLALAVWQTGFSLIAVIEAIII